MPPASSYCLTAMQRELQYTHLPKSLTLQHKGQARLVDNDGQRKTTKFWLTLVQCFPGKAQDPMGPQAPKKLENEELDLWRVCVPSPHGHCLRQGEALQAERLSTSGTMRKPGGKSAVERRGQGHIQVQSGVGGHTGGSDWYPPRNRKCGQCEPIYNSEGGSQPEFI